MKKKANMESVPQTPKKKKGKKVFIFAVLVVAIAAGGVFGGKYYLSRKNMDSFVQAIESGDQEKASGILDSKLSGGSSGFTSYLKEYVETIREQFIGGELDYSIAKARLDAIVNMGLLSDQIAEMLEWMDKINVSKVAFNNAQSFINEGKYGNAMEELKKVVQDDPDYDAAQALIESTISLYRDEIVKTAQTYLDNKDFKSAFEKLTKGLEILENDTELSSMLSKYQTEYVDVSIAEATGLVKENKYVDAVEYLENANTLVSNERFAAEISSIWDKYVTYVLDEIEKYKKAKDYVNALALATEANKNHEDDRLIGEIDILSDFQPKALKDFVVIDQEDMEVEESTFTDSYGNARTWGLSFDVYDTAYAIFNIGAEGSENGGYTQFTGTVVASPEMESEDLINFEFYDKDTGKLLGAVNNFGKTSKPTAFTVPIADVEVLEIRQVLIDGYGGHNQKCYIAEPYIR